MSTMRAILCAALLTAANAFATPARRLSTVARRATVAEWRDACGDGVVSYADFGLRLTPYLSSASAADVGREPGSCDPWDPKSPEYCSPTAPAKDTKTLRLFALFTLWYALNTGYNIGNKMVLNALPIPWTSATIELFFGLPYVGLLWASGLRKAPRLSAANVRTLCPSAFFLACTPASCGGDGFREIDFDREHDAQLVPTRPVGARTSPASSPSAPAPSPSRTSSRRRSPSGPRSSPRSSSARCSRCRS